MGEGFTRRSSELAFEGYVFDVEVAGFTSPSGEEFDRDIVRHPGAVAVLAISRPGHALVLRQWRPSVEDYLLEAPAGTLDVAGEAPEAAAARELAEEAGVSAARLTPVGRTLNTPGFCDQVSWLYLAEDLSPADREPSGAEEVHAEVLEVTLAELADATTLVDATTRMLALIALRRSPR